MITMETFVFEEFEVLRFHRENGSCNRETVSKKVISEISLKIYVNEREAASLLCLNRQQEELATGFLFNEGIIKTFDDIEEMYYNDALMAVMIKLREGINLKRQESLRSVTTGCGKCYTYINPLTRNRFKPCESDVKFDINVIVDTMARFISKSELFKKVGGVQSLLFRSPGFCVFSEDIGRHNCFDKVTGTLSGKQNGKCKKRCCLHKRQSFFGNPDKGYKTGCAGHSLQIHAHRLRRQTGRTIWHYPAGLYPGRDRVYIQRSGQDYRISGVVSNS